MKKRTAVLVALITLVVVLLVGVGVVLFLGMKDKEPNNTDTAVSTGTFADITKVEIFQNIPIVDAAGIRFIDAADYGGGTYILEVDGCSLAIYQEYLKDLEKAGFTKHSDNGENGMDGYVYTSSYTKDNLTLTVSYIVSVNKIYISATTDLPLSDHLIYDASSDKDVNEKTKLHMMELIGGGNSFIIQLKNGHFVIEDGGTEADTPYLLDYLESLVPAGEKPVIEAWFITHGDIEHYGAFRGIASESDYISRIYVEGVYYVEPSKYLVDYFQNDSVEQANKFIKLCAGEMKTQSGEAPKIYRPQVGQRYYFSDMYIDVPFTEDQIPRDAYIEAYLDETCLWLMHHIEDQKFLVGSDAGITNIRSIMMLYDKEYFDVEIMAVLDHGANVYDFFTDYCTVDTYLYPSFRVGSLWASGTDAQLDANAYLQASALESLSHGEGTVVLSFPYNVGESEKMPACDWRYNEGTPDRSNYE